MIEIHGQRASRAFRNIWLAEELGLEYEINEINMFEGQHKLPEYMAINPLGQIPALSDGDFSMGESLAINLYLAKKYGGDLAAHSDAEEALIDQWTLWVATSVETLLPPIIKNLIILPPPARDENEVKAALDALSQPLNRLDQILNEKEYLVGNRFTVADLNVASVLSMLKIAGVDIEPFGASLHQWLENCLARPACDFEMQRTEVTPEMLEKMNKMRAGKPLSAGEQ